MVTGTLVPLESSRVLVLSRFSLPEASHRLYWAAISIPASSLSAAAMRADICESSSHE